MAYVLTNFNIAINTYRASQCRLPENLKPPASSIAIPGISEAKYGLHEVDIFYRVQKITSKKVGYFPKTCHHTKRQYHVLSGATDDLTSSHVCRAGVSYSMKLNWEGRETSSHTILLPVYQLTKTTLSFCL
jgi:hypothetical protein